MRCSFLSPLAVLLIGLTSTGLANNPPTVQVALSEMGAKWWSFCETRPFIAKVGDSDGTVQNVEFYVNGVLWSGETQSGSWSGQQFFQLITANRPTPGNVTIVARAYDDGGATTDSAPVTFKIEPQAEAPKVATGIADVYSESATIRSAINTHGVITERGGIYLEWGETTDCGNILFPDPRHSNFSSLVDEEYQLSLWNLPRNTTFHCRLVVKGWAGTTVGEDLTFTTLANLPPYLGDSYAAVKGLEPVPVSVIFWDGDPGEKVTITSISAPAHGSVVVGASVPYTKLIYTPDETFEDYDQFNVTVTDEHGASATATMYLANVRTAQPGRYIARLMRDIPPPGQAGALALSVTAGANFTGVLFFRGERYPVRGQFNEEGYVEKNMVTHGGQPFMLVLSYFATRDGMKVGGNINGKRMYYEIKSEAALAFPEDAPQAGYYTISLQPGVAPIPKGDGFATGKVSARGRVGFVGRTGDGKAFSFGTQLLRGGTASFFTTVGSARRDCLTGRFRFPGTGEMECTGEEVLWRRAPLDLSYYPHGFYEYLTVTGSRFEAPEGDDPVLDYTDTLLKLGIHFTDVDAEALFDVALVAAGANESSLNLDGAATALSERAARGSLPRPPVKMKINRKRGTFSGTLRLGVRANQVKKFQGIILQHQNQGFGFVKLDAHGTGEVIVTPK